MITPKKVVNRARAWKEYVEQQLLALANDVAEIDRIIQDDAAFTARVGGLEGAPGQTGTSRQTLAGAVDQHIARIGAEIDGLRQAQLALETRLDAVFARLQRQDSLDCSVFEKTVIRPLRQRLGDEMVLGSEYEVLLSVRGSELLAVFLAPGEAVQAGMAGIEGQEALERVAKGDLTAAFVITRGADGRRRAHRADSFLVGFEATPSQALAWTEARARQQLDPAATSEADSDTAATASYFARVRQILNDIDCIDFYALATKTEAGAHTRNVPFNRPDSLPRFAPAAPKLRSVVLLHNNYYHFNCLADGLRKRGWDAVTVSLESPDNPQRLFYHGEDVNLFDADPEIMAGKTSDFFRTVPERFGSLHFCGQGYPTFFQANIENSLSPRATPWDFLELRRHRTIIGFMPSGCTDGGLQSSIRELTGGLCSHCVWEFRSDVCSDDRSLAWNRKLALLCDWVGLECDHATPERIGPKTVYGPVVTTLDPDRWHPDLAVPDDMRIERDAGEILVYHAVGNYATRRVGDRDIKGTAAVMAAIEQLKAEGLPVRLIFAHDVPSTRVRFLQVQADIVVDQLNYGRYGANAREAMMLGRPTICRLSSRQAYPLSALRPIEEAPMEDADESSVVEILRRLVLDRDRRLDLGQRAREYAVAWHGQDACAERYERVVDRIRAGLPPDCDELYPA